MCLASGRVSGQQKQTAPTLQLSCYAHQSKTLNLGKSPTRAHNGNIGLSNDNNIKNNNI